jgi:23S rRNA pseudouridine2605 synthase
VTKKSDAVRLQLYMARAGVASRRASERLIRNGVVTVNGETVTELGTKVTPGDDVRVDGRRIQPENRSIYVALNKPRRYLCSAHDPEGRPLAGTLLQPYFTERLFSVGRLDFLSSGLIFYTNDGEFARAVAHPSAQIEKEYQVDAQKPIPEELLKEYQQGLLVDGESYRLRSYRYKTPRSVRLILEEGKNREIRRVFSSWRIGVKRLHRVRIGIVELKEIPPGQYRPLAQKEIDWFFRNARPGRERDGRD